MCRLTPLIVFPRVVPPLPSGSRRLDGLAVDAAGTGFRLFPDRYPNLSSQRVMNLLPDPAPPPLMKVVAHGPFRGKIMRQGGPGTSGTQDVEDRVEDFAEVGGSRATGRHLRGQQRRDDGPLLLGEITGIRFACRNVHEEALNSVSQGGQANTQLLQTPLVCPDTQDFRVRSQAYGQVMQVGTATGTRVQVVTGT